MSLPHLLLVDDSEAILNFEKAVLSGLYQFSTACDGVEALEKIRQLRPDGVLLDLSMPRMDGDEVLKLIKADPRFSSTPILVVSSERERAEACLRNGADGMMIKPILAGDLKARVALLLETAQENQRKKNSAFLFFGVGPYELGIPLESVVSVHSQALTRPKKGSFYRFREEVVYYGQTFDVLNLAPALSVPNRKSLADRKLIFLNGEGNLALSVDGVWDPEELPLAQIHSLEDDPNSMARELWALSNAECSRGLLPVVDPGTFFSENLLSRLAGGLAKAVEKRGDSLKDPPKDRA